ncbi:FHA domain-containing protein [Synechococcales cyanobacterium C]|uniref:FHA domain-containing protein n=1 Tax=Petrachloros mirabilis ULC683 TaxID=2781853 RepID=A0A8K2A6U7_9CYAN|nr:FHA domain-containing protein [Petrachloros mirabilis]NCJ05589.1 FHA domain-containing protein [Petrachloros mirabilis ULC683]
MIVCPNCLYQNPDGAANCEACYTVLPDTHSCPNCGAPLQAHARFCGQCGFKLPPATETQVAFAAKASSPPGLEMLEPMPPAPQVVSPELQQAPGDGASYNIPAPSASDYPEDLSENPSTHLQPAYHLLHVQTNTPYELPANLQVIHLGKPNERIPPDIDIAPLPSAEVVSRIHADIYVDEGQFFLEDASSANGTYINGTFLMPGHRHRLRPGDRISLGKGDLVTFLFQLK